MIIGVIISLNISAQKLHYSLGLQVNRSQIGTLNHTPQYPDTPVPTGYYVIQMGFSIQEKYNENIGFKAIGNVDYALSSKFSIRSGIKLNLIRFQQKTELSLNSSPYGITPTTNDDTLIIFANTGNLTGYYRDENGNFISSIYGFPVRVIGNFSDVGRTTILYTEIPISVLYNYHRFSFEFGTSASIRSFSKRVVIESNELYGTHTKNSYNDSGLNRIIWHINIGVSYNLFNGLDLTMHYSRGLNGIYSSRLGNAGIAKYNIFSFGISYNLK